MCRRQITFPQRFQSNERIQGDLIEHIKGLEHSGHWARPAFGWMPGPKVSHDFGIIGQLNGGTSHCHHVQIMPFPYLQMPIEVGRLNLIEFHKCLSFLRAWLNAFLVITRTSGR